MSTERFRLGGWGLAALGALACWVCAVTPAPAAEVRFLPVLTFGLAHEGNTAIIGDPTNQGDNFAVVGAELPVERLTQRSSLSFTYRPSYVAYKEQSDLNYFDQAVDFRYQTHGSRTSQYTVTVLAYRSDQQGVRASDASSAVTFVARNTTTHAEARVHGTHQGKRNVFDWELHGSYDDYGTLIPPNPGPTICVSDVQCDDFDPATIDTCVNGSCHYEYVPEFQLQDALSAGALASWRYQLNENNSIGLGFLTDVILYDTISDVAVESLGLVGDHTFSRVMKLNYVLGVSLTTSNGANSTDATNFAGNVSLQRNITEVSTLTAGVRQDVSHGSGLGGVSLDSGAYVAYQRAIRGPGITGSVTAAYWRREPVSTDASSTQLSTDTFSGTGTIGWVFNRYLSLNLVDSYSYQTSASVTSLDTQYNTVGVNLRWMIRGTPEERRSTTP